MARAVGIDLGTACSVVAVLEGGEPTVIASAEGPRITPSVVAVNGSGGLLVGEAARRQAVTNVDRTIGSVKRHMGTDWTATIDGKKFTPQQISAYILMKLKRDTEAYLGEKITDAVITVPAYFSDAQRRATKEAGTIAGLNVLRIISESDAAGLAYHLAKENEATILVFDLGAGSLSISLIEMGEGVVEVKATSGDNHLGGDDWDQQIVDWLVKDFKSGYGLDLSKDKMALQRLREAAEKAKIELSQSIESQINLPYISHSDQGPLHLDTRLSRAEFQRMTADLIDRCKGPFQQVIKDAGFKIDDIHHVVLVGGSTRMPAVVDLVKSLTGGKEPNKGVNPDEVVAVGACLQAGVAKGEVKDSLLLTVYPLSLGIETGGGIFTKLIERNTTIPTKRSEIFTTSDDGQESASVAVYEGEREIAAYNRKLAALSISGIAPEPRGTAQIEVTIEIYVWPTVRVSVKDLGSGAEQSCVIDGSPLPRYVDTPRPRGRRLDRLRRHRSQPMRPPAPLAVIWPESWDARDGGAADSAVETKVVLVGEGAVGKTSLASALRGEEFRSHELTHGIEIHPVVVTHPDSGASTTLRLWDFGGQGTYRTTHQFFYSPHALYLVVWNARAGQDKDDVAGWIGRICQRVGDTARVMVVSTHSDEAAPDLGYAALQRSFPGMLSGHYAVDNKSGRGIAELSAALAREAAAQRAAKARYLRDMRAQSWADARDQILARAAAEPYISFGEFAAACGQHGMTEDDAVSLASLLNDRGQVTYLGDDEVLSGLVILNPEWLSKAIGHVMEDEDGAIREARGVLDHGRLGQVWRDRPGEPAYSRRLYPYFLRVMEKFDASFRLEDGAHSLIAQLVPGRKPDGIPWQRDAPVPPTQRRLALVCKLSGPVTGFMSRLTVRLGYADTGLRWRDGVFLRHPTPAYASEALIEMATDTEVRIEVRAPSPDFFLHVLRDSVEHLARSSPGLRCRMLTPCPAAATVGCGGLFPLEFLLTQRHAADVPCQECGRRYQVAELLTGLRQPGTGPGAGTADEALREALDLGFASLRHDVRDLQHDLHAAAAANADAMRRLLTVVSTEVPDCPRLFTLVRVPGRGMAKIDPRLQHFRLTLWCEEPGHWHPHAAGSYSIERSAEWFRQVARYARPVLAILRAVVPVAGPLAGIVFSKAQVDQAKNELDLTQALLDDLPASPGDGTDWADASDGATVPAAAADASLRGLRQLLNDDLDRSRRYGGLARFLTRAGDYVWVCPAHAAAYSPGLPAA